MSIHTIRMLSRYSLFGFHSNVHLSSSWLLLCASIGIQKKRWRRREKKNLRFVVTSANPKRKRSCCSFRHFWQAKRHAKISQQRQQQNMSEKWRCRSINVSDMTKREIEKSFIKFTRSFACPPSPLNTQPPWHREEGKIKSLNRGQEKELEIHEFRFWWCGDSVMFLWNMKICSETVIAGWHCKWKEKRKQHHKHTDIYADDGWKNEKHFDE